MPIVRFLFGHGWWVVWHVAFYLILLISVVMILAIFATELKPAGEKPATPSPGSLMVVLVAIGLGFVTLIDVLMLGPALNTSWFVKFLAAAAAGVVVLYAL